MKPVNGVAQTFSYFCQILFWGLGLFTLSTLARAELQVCDSHGLVRGSEIAVEKGCFGCHTVGSKRVGPAYRDIASRYEFDPATLQTLANKIKNGSSGAWGTAVMPANLVTREESLALARWILALKGESSNRQLSSLFGP